MKHQHDFRGEVARQRKRMDTRDAEIIAIGERIYRGERVPPLDRLTDARPKMSNTLVAAWLRDHQSCAVAAGMALETFVRWGVVGGS